MVVGGGEGGGGGEAFVLFLVFMDGGEGGRVEPLGRDDVGAFLAFQQEGEPEGYVGALGWVERGRWALGVSQCLCR